MGYFDDYKEVKCPDGTKRLILKNLTNIGRVFSLYVPEVDYRFKSSMNWGQQVIEGGFDAESQKKAKQILDSIDEYHIDAVNKFTMAYTLYITNSCDANSYANFEKAVNEIVKSIGKLRELDRGMKQMVSNKQLGAGGNTIDPSYVDTVIGSLSHFYK